MKLTDEQIGALWVEAKRCSPIPHPGFARAIESTVRQQDAELMRELVEALEYMLKWGHCPAADEKARAALTHAQQWLDSVGNAPAQARPKAQP